MLQGVDDRVLQLAERVSQIARQLEFETALIGGIALALHYHVRATTDVDLASCVDPFTKLRDLAEALKEQGLRAKLNMPDESDPLGGILVVREDEDSDPVEVVNFYNPLRSGKNPGYRAIQNAEPVGDSDLRCVRLPELIALKLYAGGGQDELDTLALLEKNEDADLEEIRSICREFDLEDRWDSILEKR